MTSAPPPRSALVAAFTERVFRCHHCGAHGPERRGTDQVAGPERYRYLGETLLLPFCPDCGLDRDGRRRAALALAHAVETDALAWVDRSPLSIFCCTRPRCARLWHHLGGPLPYPAVDDPSRDGRGRHRHPCPWCVDEDLTAATLDHRRALRAQADLARWEEELRPEP